ncbi:trimeric intracellular cation channel family protein [Sulfurimonas sp.]|nr:trimeric intracellular cation channel family protein [Sulfurimonas sp.]
MFEITDFIGIVTFAMSGFFVASRAKLDMLGALVATFLTALGGGIIRDISVGRTPYTFEYNYPTIIVMSIFVFMIIFKIHRRPSIENKTLFILSDSLGLISFSISGALVAIESKLNLPAVVIMSFITAVGGGIVRDVIINEVPFVLKTGFYGTISIFIGTILYFLDTYELIDMYTITLIFISFFILRMVAYYKKWAIPLR